MVGYGVVLSCGSVDLWILHIREQTEWSTENFLGRNTYSSTVDFFQEFLSSLSFSHFFPGARS